MAPVVKSMIAACCAAGGILAAGADDSHVLLQVEASAHENAPGLLMLVNRDISTPEKGSSMEWHFEPGCKVKDVHGANSCEIPWNTEVTYHGIAKLGAPLRRGDKIATKGKFAAKAGGAAPQLVKALLNGGSVNFASSCGLCAGTCQGTCASQSGVKLSMTTPSFLAKPDACLQLDTLMPTEIPLGQAKFKTPAGPDNAWGMTTDMDMGMSLLNSAGQERVSEEFHIKLRSPGQRAASLLSTGADSSLASSLGALNTLMSDIMAQTRMDSVAHQLFGIQKNSLGLVSAVRHAASEVMMESFKAAFSTGAKPEVQRAIDNLNLKVSVTNMEGSEEAHRLQLSAGQSCVKQLCKIPLGRPTAFSSNLHFKATLTEGSTATIKVRPEIGGMMGKMIKPMMMPMLSMFPMKVPACGTDPIEIAVMGRKFPFTPSPCGEYTMDFEMPLTSVTIPNFASMKLSDFGIPKMPMMPEKFGDFPSYTMVVNVEIHHADGSPIADIAVEYGAGH